ncbi:MAG: hypothetical protein Q4A09_08415 [Capnocytophaga felis]|nr:hypothetical protein [Capnocytophaga felis]
MDTQQLKQKILDLAIRGQLVPQGSNDEPASVLLEKIRAEKQTLIEQKKIKKDKKSSYITCEKSPYQKDDKGIYLNYNSLRKQIQNTETQHSFSPLRFKH